MFRSAVLFGSALALLAAAPLDAATVKGTYTINGKAYTPSHVYAVAKPDTFDKSKEGVELLFTTSPVEEKELTGVMPGSGPRLTASIGADGSLYGVVFLHDGGSLSSSGTGQSFDKKAMDATHIAGRLVSKGDAGGATGGKGSFDLTFDVPLFRAKVEPPPTAAEKAAAAKSPQAKAFAAHLAAIQSGDVAAVRKTVVAEISKMMEGPDAKEKLAFIKEMTPKKVDYLRVKETGGTATLEVETSDQKGTVDLVREGNAWKVGKQSWTGKS